MNRLAGDISTLMTGDRHRQKIEKTEKLLLRTVVSRQIQYKLVFGFGTVVSDLTFATISSHAEPKGLRIGQEITGD